MEIVLKFEAKDLEKVKDALLKDDTASRASIIFKDGRLVNKEAYFCYFSGTEEQVKRAEEITKDFAKVAEPKEAAEVIEKIKAEEEEAQKGFGNIFG
jgi:nitrogen regulatory protein PII